MAMQVKHMFGTLAVSAAAAMLAACGIKTDVAPVDPARAAATPATPTYPAVTPGEVLSAETFLNREDGRSNDSVSSPVKNLDACLNIAKERTYANDFNRPYPRSSLTSCIGEDGTARARFECFRAGTGETACRPV